ncbi:mandelate racemase/muconate lactonizing enzyme family protein [Paenibacillus piri]|uniref:Mandelate racemase/muconate lactonizing enzyme family protein n=1 Tax=Paenibacillus piri TaxID=2547395 RepID=A0A4R5KI73_9BACL|nr:mandelate racemase/muconate lactonizing enzyme family protein [Paenibacillus piri]TDF94107.1 mandelate racemase/muconate lactonizing enzyme family protein [Paenibacillus piri]
MNIKSIETFTTPMIGIVRIRTDEGAEGYGQFAPYYADITAKVLHRQLASYALGADAGNIDALVERCVTGEHKFPGSYICRAVGGLDTALWDLQGKLAGKSVCELLGGQPRKLDVYGSSMKRDIKPEDEGDRLARLQDSYGFRAFKIRVANNFGNDVDRWPGRTEAIIPAVRKAVGDKTIVHADANSGFTPKRAIEVGRMLEQYNYGHFEEPCPYPELEWTAEVASALQIPVSGGEQDTDLAQFRRMIRMGAVDIVQPDICYVGGISRALQVAKMAEHAGLPCTPHAANLSMVTVFTLHLLGAIPNGGPFMEFSIEDTKWLDGLFTPALTVKEGQVAIPDAPGWGVTINPEWLDKADYQCSTLD